VETVLFLIVFIGVPTFILLYWIIKLAVRQGILEANKIMQNPKTPKTYDSITKIICTNCDGEHDLDWPKCPHCGHINKMI